MEEIKALPDNGASILFFEKGSDGYYSIEDNQFVSDGFGYYGDFAFTAYTTAHTRFEYDSDPSKDQFKTTYKYNTELYFKGKSLCCKEITSFDFDDCFQVGNLLILANDSLAYMYNMSDDPGASTKTRFGKIVYAVFKY